MILMNYGVFLIVYFIDLAARFTFDVIKFVFYKVNLFEIFII